jgi:hypothetical protein
LAKIVQSYRNFLKVLLAYAVVIICTIFNSQAQGLTKTSYSNIHTRTYKVAGDTLKLDSLSLAGGSVQVSDIARDQFLVVPHQSIIIWKTKPADDSVTVTYRSLPLDFTRSYFHKNAKLIDSITSLTYIPQLNNQSGNFVDFNQIEYNGSYGRSVTLGNNQDVVLNSNFNLQANGYLLDSIKLEAAISDNTVPFQPEGNTQRIQEFDQIYIRLTKGPHLLQLGDFNIERPKGYFLNFYKRVQGISYETGFKLGGNVRNKIGVSGSVAKGQFARNIFEGSEGNQGPYKLTGNNGEQFFIVLANTERVYINGLLQQRGENADYIINYNTGELTFMPRRMISKDSRIQIEFEYQDRTYLNSLIYAWDELQVNKKWNLRFNAYSNQDAKNQSYTQSLSGDQKRFLSTIGDSINAALYPHITRDTFAANKILYKMVDTLVNGIFYDSVFVYSTNPDSAQYSLVFSSVGNNRGDYIISTANSNGRSYQWVAPVNGIRQGNFAPVQLLITPKKHQIFSLASNYRIDSFKVLNTEISLSNKDPNLFSKLGNQDHIGMAGRLQYSEQRFLGNKDSMNRSLWTVQNEVNYEYVQARYRAIAPYRNVEFGRDWNVPQIDENKPDEHLGNISTSLRHLRYGSLAYSLGYYQRGSIYTGYRNVASYNIATGRWKTGIVFNLTRATDTLQETHFMRPTVFAEYQFKKLLKPILGARYEGEYNRLRNRNNDTLRASAYSFDIVTAYLKTAADARTGYGLAYIFRRDQLPRFTSFLQQSHSQTIEMNTSLARWKNHRITFTGSYRELIVDDSTFNNQKAEQTLLGRFEYTGSLLRNVVQVQTLYEFGSGQEQKKSYTYLEVPAGQGLYYWVDYNGDGVQQSNEFEIGQFPDQKKFIRVFTPTNEYVRVNYINYNQSLVIDPASFWNNKPVTAFQKLISRFSDQASLQISNRLLSDQGLNVYNPFISTLRNDFIITTATTLSNTLYYNRNNAGWGIDYNYLHNNAKQLLTYGVEGNSTTQHTGKLRWNINKSFTFNTTGRSGLRQYQSALSDGRTFRISSYNIEPSITWLYRGILRFTTSLRYDERKNAVSYGNEHATNARIEADIRYSRPVAGVIALRGSYAQIKYNALTNTSVAYSMLDALLPGANFLWYANWERRVSNGIEISFEYEGRKSGESKAIHTGKMTVRAIL